MLCSYHNTFILKQLPARQLTIHLFVHCRTCFEHGLTVFKAVKPGLIYLRAM